ncbi:MAG: DUF3429 domain-containing protein, partial [Pseudomonadota bacterium]
YDLSDVPPPARWLGLAGLLPFAGLTLLAIATPDAINEEARTLLAAYGAAILSFMGGCRWGFASAGLGEERLAPGAGRGRQIWLRYIVAVAPALFVVPVMTVADPLRLILLACGLVILYSGDGVLAREGGTPVWWLSLRLPLTIGASICLLLAAAFA